jgi:hypothetical protein
MARVCADAARHRSAATAEFTDAEIHALIEATHQSPETPHACGAGATARTNGRFRALTPTV